MDRIDREVLWGQISLGSYWRAEDKTGIVGISGNLKAMMTKAVGIRW